MEPKEIWYHLENTDAIVRKPGDVICWVSGLGPRYPDHLKKPTAERDARYIAAVPDLIEALRVAIGTIRYLRPERYDDEEHEQNFNAELDQLCAAYEKATGEKL